MKVTRYGTIRYAWMAVLILALTGLGFHAVRQIMRGNAPKLKSEAEGNT